MASHKLIENINLSFAENGSIVEIGSARETAGADSSTFYFAELSKKINCEFYSVDFSPQSQSLAYQIIGKNAILSDGSAFLEKFHTISGRKISVLYLDNFDVIYNEKHRASLMRRVGNVYDSNHEELTNERSAIVHLDQMKTALPLLQLNNAVIVDDTTETEKGWWGKGALVVPFLLGLGYTIESRSEDGVLLLSF